MADYLTLKEASETVLRGIVAPRVLKAAADKGELVVYRLSERKILTTPHDLEEWLQSCRMQKGPGSTSNQRVDPPDKPNGLSETERRQSARDSALATARALKQGLVNTSSPSTHHLADIVPLRKSPSPT